MSLVIRLVQQRVLRYYGNSTFVFQCVCGSILKNTSVRSHIQSKKHLQPSHGLQVLGRQKKRRGHAIEESFRKQFGSVLDSTRFLCGSDNTIRRRHPIIQRLVTELKVNGLEVSNKSGKNIQFTIGQIPQWTHVDAETLHSYAFNEHTFQKYLKKMYTDTPCDMLVYYDEQDGQWIFFNMDVIVRFIADNVYWRILPSGRIKGDFFGRQYLTYEYRVTHRSYFLGANGNRGELFIRLLQQHIPSLSTPIHWVVE